MKNIFSLLIVALIAVPVIAQSGKNTTFNLLISPYSPKGVNQSISVYTFNATTGESAFRTKVDGVVNPSYIVVSPDKNFVYSVTETGNGGISAFSFDQNTGNLVFINKVSSGGNGPCYVSMDDKGKYVFASNYGGGSVTAVPVNTNGSLSSDIQTIVHQPKSGNKGRQQGSHAHSAVVSEDNKFLIVPDLGTDKINIYRIDLTKTSNPLTPSDPAFLAVKEGSGPRHFIFNSNSKYAYLIHELQGFISVYDFKDGLLTEKQTITMLSDDFKGRIGGADIHISPDNKFLYASNRGDADEIVIYKIIKDGKLQLAGRQSTIGKHPRNFAIDPTGNFLLVGNNTTDNVTIFKRDKKTGLLTPTNNTFPVVQPGCLKFVAD